MDGVVQDREFSESNWWMVTTDRHSWQTPLWKNQGSWWAVDLLMKMQDDSCQKMCKGEFIHVKITNL